MKRYEYEKFWINNSGGWIGIIHHGQMGFKVVGTTNDWVIMERELPPDDAEPVEQAGSNVIPFTRACQCG